VQDLPKNSEEELYQVTFDVAIEPDAYVFDTWYCLELPHLTHPIGNSDPKDHLIFPDYANHSTWNILRNILI
jgi:hypothetical protein